MLFVVFIFFSRHSDISVSIANILDSELDRGLIKVEKLNIILLLSLGCLSRLPAIARSILCIVQFCPYSLSTPLIPTMTAPYPPAPPPVAPMSPMGMSPMGMSPSRTLSPHRYLSPPKQTATTPEQVLSSPPVSALQSKCSPPTNLAGHQRPPSPAGEAPPSSGSATSSSDSGSDSGSDSSDDSEDEDDKSEQLPVKEPSTPPSTPPKPDNAMEELPPAIEESKRRWDLSSFLDKTAVQHGEQNSESKPAQVRMFILIKDVKYLRS